MKRLNEFLSTQHNLSGSRKDSYFKAVKNFDRFAEAEFEDSFLDPRVVHAALDLLQKGYAASTWNTWLTCYKRYAKWLSDLEDMDCPKVWKKIKPIKIDWEEKLKNKWLTEEELLSILDAVDYAKDKAMYGVAVEGALRPGELLNLKIGDCKPASYGFDVTVSGKTGTNHTKTVILYQNHQ
jgi:integrase